MRYLVQSKFVSGVGLVASLILINKTKVDSDTCFLLEILEAVSNLAHGSLWRLQCEITFLHVFVKRDRIHPPSVK